MNYFKGLALGAMLALGVSAYGRDRPGVYRCTDEIGNKGFRIELEDKFSGSDYNEKVDAAERMLGAEMANAGLKKRLLCAPRTVSGNTVYINPKYMSKKEADFFHGVPETDCL